MAVTDPTYKKDIKYEIVTPRMINYAVQLGELYRDENTSLSFFLLPFDSMGKRFSMKNNLRGFEFVELVSLEILTLSTIAIKIALTNNDYLPPYNKNPNAAINETAGEKNMENTRHS